MNDNLMINLYTDIVVAEWAKFEKTDIFKKVSDKNTVGNMNYISLGKPLRLVIDSIDGVKMGSCRMEVKGTSIELHLQYLNRLSQHGTRTTIDNSYEFYKTYFYKKDKQERRELITGLIPSREMITNVFTQIVTDLKTITFEPLKGRLVCAIENVDKQLLEAKLAMSSLGECKNGYDECCVCQDTTITKFTKCGHHCCCRCISNIVLLEDQDEYDSDGDDVECLSCPMCRDIIKF